MIKTINVTNGDTRTTIAGGDVENATTLVFDVEGITGGSFTPQVTMDGTNYRTCAVYASSAPATEVTSITAEGCYSANIAGVQGFALAHSSPTGTVVIKYNVVNG